MNDKEKKTHFDRGGTLTVHLFLKPPGQDGMWKGPRYKDGFNIFCNTNGSGAEPRLLSRHLAPQEALDFANALDAIPGNEPGTRRTVTEWVGDSLDLMPGALDQAIREAENHVGELKQIRSALTGRY